jgi:acyl-CoA reductase-like NAD-dependent aldehyde dehydrogenase
MESRRSGLIQSLVRGGQPDAAAVQEVDSAIDRVVFYAGFADKFFALLASSNPVAGPHFTFSVPEPMGAIGVIAPDRPALLGLVSTILPIVTGGNTSVVLAGDA